jgi:nicotinamide-nucleotide amidase
MTIELVNTGTELLIGDVINTNAAWLGQRMVELGPGVQRCTTVPDGAAIEVALREACLRADVVIVTGGLGPTSDDVSREAAAAVFGVPMDLDEGVMRGLTEYFARRGKPVNEHNRRQAMVPRGAVVLPNPNGTAPGLFIPSEIGKKNNLACAVFLLPGPPRELKPMVAEQVEPRLRAMLPGGADRECRYFKFTGLGESDISMALQEDLEKIAGLELGFCIGKGDVDVRVAGPRAAIVAAADLCFGRLGEFLVSDDRRMIEQVVVDLLQQRGQWVATAESCTGGFIAHRITNVPGASNVLAHGFVTYGNGAKTQHLHVPAELITEQGAVSAPVVAAMADGCLRVSGADHAVAVSGIAGPGGGSEAKPVGTVFIALASKGHEVEVRRRWFRGEREWFKTLTSQAALDFLRRRLCGYGIPE